jgi:hypothetical protein
MTQLIEQIAALVTAFVFGGMALFSFGFAAILFSALEPAVARLALRKTFPFFYLFVIITSIVCALLWISSDVVSAFIMGFIAITTVWVRQSLMPAINTATDAGARTRFNWMHTLSVLVTLVHIVLLGWVVIRPLH